MTPALMHRCRALALTAVVITACKSDPTEPPQVGSNSNWLSACQVASDCASAPACACGVCTTLCQLDTDCDGLFDARCAAEESAAAQSSCGQAPPGARDATAPSAMSLCLPRCEPGTCAPEQACVGGSCVLAPLPATPLCSTLRVPSQTERALEEELLALLDQRRAEGGLPCARGATSQTERALHPALRCAARALAADMQQTRALSLIDSLGRDTPARLQLTGYAPRMWGESYALQARTAAEALDLMQAEPAACARLQDDTLTEVGVGLAGDVLVITLATR